MGKRLTSSYGRGLLRLQSAGRGETIDGSSSREVTMHARVSSYQASDPERLVEGFRSVTDSLEGIDGFSHAYFMVDHASGKAMSITIWDSEEALTASVSQADELRKRGTAASGTAIQSVQHYEIPLTVGTPTRT
jgi:heme-degrading monooxygenase HmoA